jgi:hypothetical protein
MNKKPAQNTKSYNCHHHGGGSLTHRYSFKSSAYFSLYSMRDAELMLMDREKKGFCRRQCDDSGLVKVVYRYIRRCCVVTSSLHANDRMLQRRHLNLSYLHIL